MIRRDYFLRMIEEFTRALAKIIQQKEQHQWREAATSIEAQARRLTGEDLATLGTLTDTELLARLLQTGEFQALREKTLMLARVLIEAAETADAENREGESADLRSGTQIGNNLRLKALHLLLKTVLNGDIFEWPEFVPNIDLLLLKFAGAELPVQTHALLMQHFERSGQFARAEDALFAMLESEPEDPSLPQWGISFYRRMLDQSDSALEAGDLPRGEVQTGLGQMQERTIDAAGKQAPD